MIDSELGLLTLKNDDKGILRKVAERVDLEDIQNIQDLIDFMFKVVDGLGAIGLAAPQIGVSKQIFVLKDGTVCINPTVVGRNGKITSHAEGCLSVDNQRFDVKRAREVTIKYFDRSGKLQTLKPRNKITNIAIQHEMDHLNGRLICDRGRPRN